MLARHVRFSQLDSLYSLYSLYDPLIAALVPAADLEQAGLKDQSLWTQFRADVDCKTYS